MLLKTKYANENCLKKLEGFMSMNPENTKINRVNMTISLLHKGGLLLLTTTRESRVLHKIIVIDISDLSFLSLQLLIKPCILLLFTKKPTSLLSKASTVSH